MLRTVLLKHQQKPEPHHGGHIMGNIIIVHRPELTEEERARRMEEIKQATVKLVIATERCKQERMQKYGAQN